jgi:hypothetical protein
MELGGGEEGRRELKAEKGRLKRSRGG